MDATQLTSSAPPLAEKRKQRKNKLSRKSSSRSNRSKSDSPEMATLNGSRRGFPGVDQAVFVVRKRYDDDPVDMKWFKESNKSITGESFMEGAHRNIFKGVDLPPGCVTKASSKSRKTDEAGPKRSKSKTRLSRSGSPSQVNSEDRFRDMGSAFRTLERRASSRRVSLSEAKRAKASGRTMERRFKPRRSVSNSPPPKKAPGSARAASVGDSSHSSQTDPELRELDLRLSHRLKGRSNSVPSIRNMLLNTDVDVITRKAKQLEEKLLEEKEAQEELRKATLELRTNSSNNETSSSSTRRMSVGRITRAGSLKSLSRSPLRDALVDAENKPEVLPAPKVETAESKRMAVTSRTTPFGGYQPEGSSSSARFAEANVVGTREDPDDELFSSKSHNKGMSDSSSVHSTLSQRIVQKAVQMRDEAAPRRERSERLTRKFRRRSRSTSVSSRASAEASTAAG